MRALKTPLAWPMSGEKQHTQTAISIQVHWWSIVMYVTATWTSLWQHRSQALSWWSLEPQGVAASRKQPETIVVLGRACRFDDIGLALPPRQRIPSAGERAMRDESEISRRDFLKTAAVTAVAALPKRGAAASAPAF
jgi:hypothetical protein